jgi:tetratricopeptide (TPR) repeat protein
MGYPRRKQPFRASYFPRALRGRISILAGALSLGILLCAGAFALDRKDLQDCEASPDVPRMIEACTAIADEKRLPAGMRSMALLKRGFGNFALDKLDAAAADFSAAVELDPKNNYAHHELGLTRARKGDLDGALVALNEAVRLAPDSAASRYSRANVLAALGRMDEAIADYTAAIALGADKNTAYTNQGQMERPAADRVQADYFVARAAALYLTGRFRDAVADYDRAKPFPDPTGYNLIWGTLARRSSGSRDATGDLVSALDAGRLTGWPKVVGELVAGRATPAAALAAAKDGDQACEAHFYSGAVSMAGNDLASAKRELSIARDTCPKSFREYNGAVTLLRRL